MPACFASDVQWQAWRTAAAIVAPNPYDDYCEDCTPTYRDKMCEAGRCAHPGVTFTIRVDGDGLGIEGRRP